jgi:dimethylglycine dehydrogenase
VQENYSRRFRIQFPNEVLPAGRPLQTSPVYDRLVAENAVWGDAYGLEVPLWFQEPGLDPSEEVTFGRSNSWNRVRGETLAVRNGVGVMETTGFAKFAVDGPGARSFLDRLITNSMPKPGRMVLAPMVNDRGMLIGDLTVACLGPTPGQPEGPSTTPTGGATQNDGGRERFIVFGTGGAERFYQRWFDQHLPGDGSVTVTTFGWELCGLAIAGPSSRELLARLTTAEVSNDAFRFMDFRAIDLGMVPVWCGRVSYTGDLGYEFWMTASRQRAVLELLLEHGRDLDIGLFGLQALDSLRLDKSFGSWAREYRPIYTPFEAGLDRFVKLDGGDFVGRDALVAAAEAGPKRRLLTWTVDAGQGARPAGVEPADVIGDEPIWHGDEVVGWVTSGGYSHFSDASVAMGYVPADLASSSGPWSIEIIGDRRPATLVDGCLWDRAGERLRS